LIVAAGDIACVPGAGSTDTACQQQRTGDLARSYAPRRVLTLGDHQYPAGSLSDFQRSYDPAWGSLRSVTSPVPGNHEYGTSRASGYYSYFDGQQPGAPGYYAFDLGSWRVYALNTNCSFVSCDRQNRWLQRNMTNHPRRCSLVTMHHPRYSSGKHGSQQFVRPFWRTAVRHRTDVALAGHDHTYERFAKMDAWGSRSRTGIRSFVSGAGGSSLHSFGPPVAGSVVRRNDAFGVLALRLGRGVYAWEYQTIDGEVLDSGTGTCH